VTRSALFISTSNLASNPRLLKELGLAMNYFDEIEVIQFSLGGWSDRITEKLKRDFPVISFVELSATRKPILPWALSTLQQLVLKKINYKWLNCKLISFSLNKRSIILSRYLGQNKNHYDWIIAHNPGAFYPAYEIANRINGKLGLDIEDYHPGEYIHSAMSERMLEMMKCILPQAHYCSFAAPLIQKEIESKIPNKTQRWFTVINGFSQGEFIEPSLPKKSDKIKMVWFSQNITPGRGLEKFIQVMSEFKDVIEFHLIGDLSVTNKDLLFKSNAEIIIHPPMLQAALHKFLSSFHVGLAADPPINRNRELAITNKLLAYAQAGLFIISISAQGQNEFLEQSGLNFKILENEENQIKQCLNGLVEYYRKDKLNSRSQFDIAKKYSWESMNSELIKVWKE
jgi:glycosyltransferase involved in cell wall biosynthesis